MSTLVSHISAHKIDFGLWCTRVLTLYFALIYLIPFIGNPYEAYYKALAAMGATSALRLHQRLPRISFTREFLSMLLAEDSAHYLFYCMIFMYSNTITVVLMPIGMFAALHAASYTLTMLDALGMGRGSTFGLAKALVSLVELQSRNILRAAAFSEIFLLPIVIVMIFMGRATLFTPFLYYRFLSLRYASRRNPYTRNMFHELRVAIEEAASSPRFPQGARNLLHKAINFISRMAPVQQAA
jgi:hypothetical protein